MTEHRLLLLLTSPGSHSTLLAAQQLLLKVQTVMQDISDTKPNLPHPCNLPLQQPRLYCHTASAACLARAPLEGCWDLQEPLTYLHHTPLPWWGQHRCVLAAASARGH